MVTKRTTKKTAATGKKLESFSNQERDAMRERVRELREGKSEGERVVLAKIAAMPEPDRAMAKRIHTIIRANAPSLTPKLWYGMPAYANEEGKVACFFQAASKFKYRYATLGFQEAANLDAGNFWPVSFALKKLTPADESKIAALVKKAVS